METPKRIEPLHFNQEEDIWKQELRRAYRKATDLVTAGLIRPDDAPKIQLIIDRYQFLLTPYYAGLIDQADPLCPIRRQSIPDISEFQESANLIADPLHDLDHRPAPRITHRYRNRALIHLTPNCSMYCRFCFRKTLLNELSEPFFSDDLAKSLDYVRHTLTIDEIIFSGGDPFLANEAVISRTLAEIDGIDHIKRVRFHSRVPVTLPMRITDSFADLLARSRKPIVVVTHFNHPRELTPVAISAVKQLKRRSMVLLNQSTLLRGVNDSSDTLATLSNHLFEAGILPYYLHHPDLARGTFHFQMTAAEGIEIYNRLRAQVSGYLTPRYVVDDFKLPYKKPLF